MANDFPLESIYSIKGVLLAPFISVGLVLFLLGFYVLLFGLTVYFLCTQQKMVNRKLHLGLMTVLFVLSVSSALFTAASTIKAAVLGFRAAFQKFGPLDDWESPSAAHLALDIIPGANYVLANCIADTILLYRCFMVWKSMRHIVIVAGLVLFLTNAVGFFAALTTAAAAATRTPGVMSFLNVGSLMATGYYIANAINGFLLTIVIAGRIWWMSRESRQLMGHQVERKYNRIVAMLVESGVLYSISLVLEASTRQNLSSIGFGLDMFPLVELMVGIAPTMIILRASLGLTEGAVPDSQMISTLRFGESPAAGATEHSEVHSTEGSADASTDLEAPKVERSNMSASSVLGSE